MREQGEQGEQGKQGRQGRQGDKGTRGENLKQVFPLVPNSQESPSPLTHAQCPMPTAQYPITNYKFSATRLRRRSWACISSFVQDAAKVLKPQLTKGLGILYSKRLSKSVPFSVG
ncbi:hypothetical protein NIES4072_58080 [Nostoc commune NIES-4072]|uniref:Uncharacterized protein n=1 Tax=Nostoc commune NIES-4072 TaxID=2005467 RepID=A0A2R5FTL4_NOSCO|nr:hypothetical protein NIES4070_32850 [Nostoc commune HK-02]GBG22102.1 hypothetical protein NIES4072_58080 [Nostoc commune NIES-4072]